MEIGRWMGSLHPALIHFPIAILIVAVVTDAVALIIADMAIARFARGLLLVGMVSTLFAFVCGNFAELWAARTGVGVDAIEYHEYLATVTSWTFVGLTAWRLLMGESTHKLIRWLWVGFGTVACVMICVTGHTGASLVYDHGAAVRAIPLKFAPSHDALVTLTQRQDSDSIFYSNMMHHIFGWIVFVLSGLLFCDSYAPHVGHRLRRVGPLLLLAGGAFLLIFSDQDAWPLYRIKPYLPLWDKEVLLHKTYAVLLLLVGLKGLWTQVRNSKTAHSQVQGKRIQNRTMAAFALVGGALLFTHVHSVAPYSNIAVGVYLHHTVMGLIALSIGAVKLLEDVKPHAALRFAYPALMLTESIFLIRYNEGLPWFLGYDDRQVIARHGGHATPIGPYSAELAFDERSGLLRAWISDPVSHTTLRKLPNSIVVTVKQGDESTDLTLLKQIQDGVEVFQTQAVFLRRQPIFTAELKLPMVGSQWVAYFEPWISPSAIAVAKGAWSCPMHPEIAASSPGSCLQCNMPLAPTKANRSSGESHDPDIQLKFDSQPEGRPNSLTYRINAGISIGGVPGFAPLSVVHTRKMHLMIVSEDLSFFDHIHPEELPTGEFNIQYKFPAGGNYRLFWDCTPVNRANQVFRTEFHVPGPTTAYQKLTPSQSGFKIVDGYQIGFRVSPFPATSKDESVIEFEIRRDGRPVTDLEPFLGAPGHCVTIDERSRNYLHSHPVHESGDSSYGPIFRFHTRFPKGGLYKSWGQFSHHGKIIVADFVFRVD